MYFVIGLLLSIIMFVSILIIVKNGLTRGTAPLMVNDDSMCGRPVWMSPLGLHHSHPLASM